MQTARKSITIFVIGMACLFGRPGRTAEPAILGLSDASTLGSDTAPVTLIEFSDYGCFYCRRHMLQIQPLLVENYVKTGKLRYVILEVPGGKSDTPGFIAAESARCAGDQGRYWEMRTQLFNAQEDLSVERFITLAQKVGLKIGPFETCLAERKYRDRLLRESRYGTAAGVRAVPTFFLGLTDSENADRLRVTKTIVGSKVYRVYASAIDRLLIRAKDRGNGIGKQDSQ